MGQSLFFGFAPIMREVLRLENYLKFFRNYMTEYKIVIGLMGD